MALGDNQNMKACAIQSFDAILIMVEKLKLWGLALALCPCSGDFIEFKSPKVRLTP
ncbi:hypothetical protein HpBT026_11670 [Helicobacter pylori]